MSESTWCTWEQGASAQEFIFIDLKAGAICEEADRFLSQFYPDPPPGASLPVSYPIPPAGRAEEVFIFRQMRHPG